MIELSKDQESCFDDVMSWVRSPSKLLTMGGFAGCGKSTLIGKFRESLSPDIRIAFCCFTGKAASVLKSKLRMIYNKVYPDDECGTIHSLIYEPVFGDDGIIEKWVLKDSIDFDLIIIDEASMVSESIYKDLQSFGLPILAVGDHGQLPPIKGSLNLMKDPMIKLEKVHRFAEQSPLTQISIMAREQGRIPYGTYGDTVHKVKKNHSMVKEFVMDNLDFKDSAILCGFNKTRVKINKNIRKELNNQTKLPRINERLICLKNNKNASDCPIYNGVLGTLKECRNHGEYLKVKIKIDGEHGYYKGKIDPDIFNDPSPFLGKYILMEADNGSIFSNRKVKVYLDGFDFGYSLTVHKSQGSEWNSVMLIEQPCKYWADSDWNRWLYTAVTRSRNRLLIVR